MGGRPSAVGGRMGGRPSAVGGRMGGRPSAAGGRMGGRPSAEGGRMGGRPSGGSGRPSGGGRMGGRPSGADSKTSDSSPSPPASISPSPSDDAKEQSAGVKRIRCSKCKNHSYKCGCSQGRSSGRLVVDGANKMFQKKDKNGKVIKEEKEEIVDDGKKPQERQARGRGRSRGRSRSSTSSSARSRSGSETRDSGSSACLIM